MCEKFPKNNKRGERLLGTEEYESLPCFANFIYKKTRLFHNFKKIPSFAISIYKQLPILVIFIANRFLLFPNFYLLNIIL